MDGQTTSATPEQLAVAAVHSRLVGMMQSLVVFDVRGLREQIARARDLSAIGYPGKASRDQALAVAEEMAEALDLFRSQLQRRGVLDWLARQGLPKKVRRRAAVRA